MRYSPSLDGLRAVAILPVLLFHVTPGVLKGGFTGVDVFFVLSGYLIASVILHGIRADGFSLREFYLRRVQRLLPNIVTMVLVTLAIAVIALTPSATVKLARHGLWTLFNLSNIHIWRDIGGYWGNEASSVPLLHTWSLAVEEQFYLLFPAILCLLTRRAPTSIPSVVALLACASFALCAFGTWAHPQATFYLLPTRAWEPLLGAALAAYQVSPAAKAPMRSLGPPLALEVLGWSGLAMIAAGAFLITEDSRFPGVVALLPTLGTLAVLAAVSDGSTRVARLLSVPLLVMIGTLSYSLYLWHWPLIVIGRAYAESTGRPAHLGALVGACLCLPVAWLAFRWVERPLRSRGPGRPARLGIIASGFAICAACCLAVSLQKPVADPEGVYDRPTFDCLRYTVVDTLTHDDLQSSIALSDVLAAPAEPQAPEVWRTGGIVHDWGQGPPRIVVLGSSHAAMYGGLIDDVCRQLGVSVAFLSANNSSVFFPTRAGGSFASPANAGAFDAARRRWLSEWKPDAVLVIDRWDGRWDGSVPTPETFEARMRGLVRELSPHTGRVIVFSQVPVLEIGDAVNLREVATWHLRARGVLPRIRPDGNEPFRRRTVSIFEAMAREDPKVRVLRADRPFYLEDGTVRYSAGRSFYYADHHHLSGDGTRLLRESCMRAIADACSQ